MSIANAPTPFGPRKTITVTRRPESVNGVILEILFAPWKRPVTTAAKSEASEVLEALFELPIETRRELQLLMAENLDTFCGVPYQKGTPRTRQPVKGSPGGGR